MPLLRGGLRLGRQGGARQARGGRGRPASPRQPRRHLPQAPAPARRRALARPGDHSAYAREPRRALAARHVAARDSRPRQAPPVDRRRARPRRADVLRLRPAPDGGLLRRQQAGEGVRGHEQRGLELAPVYVERGRGIQGHVRVRRTARLLRRHRPGRLHAAAGHEHGGLPSDRLVAHPAPAAGGRPADRDRPAAHPNGRGGRSPPAREAGGRPRAAQLDDQRDRARRARRREVRGGQDRGRRAGDRRGGGMDARARGRGNGGPGRGDRRGGAVLRRRHPFPRALVDGGQPVERGHAEEPRTSQPLPR